MKLRTLIIIDTSMPKHDPSFHVFIAFKYFLASFENVPFYEQCRFKQPLSDLVLHMASKIVSACFPPAQV